MNILVFLQGTVIMHKSAAGKSREEIVKQVQDEDPSVKEYAKYIPIGRAVEKLKKWAAQGAEIQYLSALTESKMARTDERTNALGLEADQLVLRSHGFREGRILHRGVGESYQDVVGTLDPLPDVLIEDDCESIGRDEMTYPKLDPAIKSRIHWIKVPEFGGIDHLPDDISKL